jgi:hypothetical protein
MDTPIRLKYEMGTRARDLQHAHPDPNPLAVEKTAALDDRLERARVLGTQQETGRIAARAATAERAQLRFNIRERPLRHLVRIARAANKSNPGLKLRFRLPKVSISSVAFLSSARAMMQEAGSHRDLFIRYGMPEGFLDDLAAALAAYDMAINEANAGRTAHVGATAELTAVIEEVMGLVDELDAMNQLRFQDQPELAAAWASARNIPWPEKSAADPEATSKEPAA